VVVVVVVANYAADGVVICCGSSSITPAATTETAIIIIIIIIFIFIGFRFLHLLGLQLSLFANLLYFLLYLLGCLKKVREEKTNRNKKLVTLGYYFYELLLTFS
jgi:hypothetical protein